MASCAALLEKTARHADRQGCMDCADRKCVSQAIWPALLQSLESRRGWQRVSTDRMGMTSVTNLLHTWLFPNGDTCVRMEAPLTGGRAIRVFQSFVMLHPAR